MQKKIILITAIIPLLFIPVFAQEPEYKIPSWVKVVAGAWANGGIDDVEYQNAMGFLIENGIISINNNPQIPQCPEVEIPIPNECEVQVITELNDQKYIQQIQILENYNQELLIESEIKEDAIHVDYRIELDKIREERDNFQNQTRYYEEKHSIAESKRIQLQEHLDILQKELDDLKQ